MSPLMPKGMRAPRGAASNRRNWLKILLIAVAVLIVFVVLIVGCVFSMGGPVMKSGENFVMMISAGKVDLAYESAATQFKEEVDREAFQSFLEEYPILTKVQSVSFTQFIMENDLSAMLKGTIVGTDGQTSPLIMNLVKENDGWRVLYLDLNAPLPEGQQPAGDMMAPPPMPGEPLPGEPLPGEPMPGELMPGELMPGELMPGELMPGELMPSLMPGEPVEEPAPTPGA